MRSVSPPTPVSDGISRLIHQDSTEEARAALVGDLLTETETRERAYRTLSDATLKALLGCLRAR